jgi:hypothetical protein
MRWVGSDYGVSHATSDILGGLDQEFLSNNLAPAALKPLVDPSSPTFDPARCDSPDETRLDQDGTVGGYGSLVRTNLTVEDLGGFLDQPRVAVVATLRTDGSVLLSPVWYEWRDGGFNVRFEAQNVKVRDI